MDWNWDDIAGLTIAVMLIGFILIGLAYFFTPKPPDDGVPPGVI